MSMESKDIRYGFVVDQKRQQLWKVELELFEDFKRICKKYDLSYFLIGGAAIGAVRHKGFIPWDDDLDIGMPRSDFDKLIKVRDEFNENSFLEYGLNDSCTEFYHFCRIRDKNSTGYIREQYKKPGIHGVFIEIYPFDDVPESRKIRKLQWSLSRLFIQILYHRVYKENIGNKTKLIDSLLSFISTPNIYRLWYKICTVFNNKKFKMVDTVSIPNYSPSEVDFFFAEDIADTVEVPFESTTARVPIGNDRCLRKTYGDYMQLPPENQRGTHHNAAVFYDPTKKYDTYSMAFLENYFDMK